MSAASIRQLRGVVALVLTLVFAPVPTRPALAGDPGQTETEIRYLLEFVAHSGCTFTRNGTAHDPAGAADHLRLKYERGKHYAGSAEQFIDRLASESSWSGKPYTVDCDGTIEPSKDWLHRALADYRRATDTDTGTGGGLDT